MITFHAWKKKTTKIISDTGESVTKSKCNFYFNYSDINTFLVLVIFLPFALMAKMLLSCILSKLIQFILQKGI